MRIVSDVLTCSTLGGGGEPRRQQPLEALQVGRDDLEDEVDLAVEHMAFADLGNLGDMRLECLEVAFGLAAQLTIANTVRP